jgi:hypothetical protein
MPPACGATDSFAENHTIVEACEKALDLLEKYINPRLVLENLCTHPTLGQGNPGKLPGKRYE